MGLEDMYSPSLLNMLKKWFPFFAHAIPENSWKVIKDFASYIGLNQKIFRLSFSYYSFNKSFRVLALRPLLVVDVSLCYLFSSIFPLFLCCFVFFLENLLHHFCPISNLIFSEYFQNILMWWIIKAKTTCAGFASDGINEMFWFSLMYFKR